MAGEQAKRIVKAGQDATAEAIRSWQENGELRHLQGRRLDLDDNSPDWLVNHILKQNDGVPPVVERGRDLDRLQRETDAIVERLRQRRTWLTGGESTCTPDLAQSFNRSRTSGLEEYRTALSALDRAIRDYNLVAPSALHRYGMRVDHIMAEAAREIPPLPVESNRAADVATQKQRGPTHRRLWQRLRGRE